MIIAVSDVHLGFSKSNKADFIRFLDWIATQPYVTDFVLAGDILDFWRRDMVAVTMENADVMARLIAMYKSGMNIYYIAGNHDYTVRHLKIFPNRFKFSTKVELVEDGVEYTFVHGHEFDPDQNTVFFDPLCYTNDQSGRFADRVWDVYSKYVNPLKYPLEWIRQWISKRTIDEMVKPPEERGYVSTFAPDTLVSVTMEGVVTVSGHTHAPGIYRDTNSVNTGSWVQNPDCVFNTYVVIDGDEIHLRRFS
ncbi:MAG: UDP-2,3-diacylglucosamine diphosphatase [candidate division Zixibacteria bacterium]|nr:UDP-2,3-diacylglucosamine diphosphatase [candidate division Zixibacteria bacterium]